MNSRATNTTPVSVVIPLCFIPPFLAPNLRFYGPFYPGRPGFMPLIVARYLERKGRLKIMRGDFHENKNV